MRTIKFRGRVFDGHRFNAGEMVYGSLITYKEGLFDRYEIQRVEDEFFVNYRVDEDSIAQFVGYDADGREVYEGDILVDDNGSEMPAMLFALQFSGKVKEARS